MTYLAKVKCSLLMGLMGCFFIVTDVQASIESESLASTDEEDAPANRVPVMYATMLCIRGVEYIEGDGVLRDAKEAERLWTLAADQGLAEAQYNLGVFYYKGDGVPVDKKKAIRFFTLAAAQEFATAQYTLGDFYYRGDGVPTDRKKLEDSGPWQQNKEKRHLKKLLEP